MMVREPSRYLQRQNNLDSSSLALSRLLDSWFNIQIFQLLQTYMYVV